MKYHSIPYDEAEQFQFKNVIAATHGPGGSKRLLAFSYEWGVNYEVTCDGETVAEFDGLLDAVNKYNDLPR